MLVMLEFVSPPPPAPSGFNLASSTIGTDGAALYLFVGNDPDDDVHARDDTTGASFPRTRMAQARPFKLVILRPDGSTTIDIPPLDLTFPHVDLLPDGRVLLAGARCSWRGPGDHDLNGAIFDPRTDTLTRILLGDGIADVATDSLGRIWVSYFDEGVLGNFGWAHRGPPGPGAGGLVCFDDAGAILWTFNTRDEAPIVDCYALNATREAIWAFYYSGFEVCRIDKDFMKTSYGQPIVGGAHAFAVSDTAFLFTAVYGKPADVVQLVPWDGVRLGKSRKVRVRAPDGLSLDLDRANVVGRGRHLHFLQEGGWFRLNVESVAKDAGWVSAPSHRASPDGTTPRLQPKGRFARRGRPGGQQVC